MSCRAIHSRLLKCLQCPILPYPTISCFLLLSMYTCQDGSTPTCSHLSLTGKLSLSSVKPQYFGTKLGYRFFWGTEPINATRLRQFHTSKMCNHENLFNFQGWAGCFWRKWVKVKHTNWKCVLQVQVSSVNPNSKDVCLQKSVFTETCFGWPTLSDPLERPAWGLQTMRGGQLAGGSGDPCKSARPLDT